MTPHHTSLIATMATAAALLALPVAGASAATKPGASTGPAAGVTDQSASLTGNVDPQGSATTYSFQYGPTIAYGSATPPTGAGSGTAATRVVVKVDSLTPNTRYHYRIVAQNAGGTTLGAGRTFRTAKQPLGFQIAATPNPILFGQTTTVAGTLTGTGGGNREVVLQQRQFPYTSAYAQVGNPQVTSPTGTFSFPGVAVPLNTQFRVSTNGGPNVTSPVVTAGVAVRVSTLVSSYRVRRGGLVRFSGHIAPARDDAQIGVQKLSRDGRWVTVAGTIARHSTATKSRYAKRVRVRRGGSYRIYALIADGNYVSNVGRTIRLRTR